VIGSSWQKIVANVDSLLETARVDVVVGKDGSNRRNTKIRIRVLDYRGNTPCGVPPKCPEKSCLGNRAFLELNGEFEIVLR
jgi:hypothetical protein